MTNRKEIVRKRLMRLAQLAEKQALKATRLKTQERSRGRAAAYRNAIKLLGALD